MAHHHDAHRAITTATPSGDSDSDSPVVGLEVESVAGGHPISPLALAAAEAALDAEDAVMVAGCGGLVDVEVVRVAVAKALEPWIESRQAVEEADRRALLAEIDRDFARQLLEEADKYIETLEGLTFDDIVDGGYSKWDYWRRKRERLAERLKSLPRLVAEMRAKKAEDERDQALALVDELERELEIRNGH